jgi:hypothetical protein
MSRLTPLLVIASTALVSCYTTPQSRPFAGRGGRNLDQPPRYGDSNRYVEPIAPAPTNPAEPTMALDPAAAAAAAAAGVDPRTIPPAANTTPPAGITGGAPVDPGLTVAPPTTAPAPTVPGVTPPTVTAPTTPTATAPGDVPFARAVPGKPGYVFSPKDPKKVISVEGLRPGSKAKDPETGEIFRVP